jgi:hypothetical protein
VIMDVAYQAVNKEVEADQEEAKEC